ncbi:serine hydrolase [Arenibacter sp. ARW7G5Y1]|uniref:serine hydrolase domain-containing protein n=1 Tax=Arenibacter sp. ARW7G5Y1 TaxID=2135619 RepID=UPI000D75BFA7|nr:serine hydrolase domain-containing protein [Arenibacter sp. ARW7G5Y1]PXX30518.1 CubicO group peptidase (beta-lactamase class C family) [Arenibacter sp. ARW7G5Y1]
MKNIYQYFICSCIVASLWSCTTKKSEEPKDKNTQMLYSSSYKAQEFVQDSRRKKITEHAPEVENLIREHMKEHNIPGVAYGIVVDNELVAASAMGLMNLENKQPATTKSSFRIASLTKSFTAMAILKLRDEGKLSLDDAVVKYIPELGSMRHLTTDSPSIDIENLMTMTSGLPEDNPWGDRQLDESEQMLFDLIKNGLSLANPPSHAFEYSNTSYALLGQIISRVSRTPYQTYITNNILRPLGMEETYWEYSNIPKEQLVLGYRWEDEEWKQEPMLHDGAFGAIGGLITSIEDFGKYVSFHLSAWPPRSDQDNGPVKRSTLREMHRPHFPRLNAQGRDFNGDTCPSISSYGYGLGITEDCNGLKRVSHGGALPGYGSSYSFFPEYGIGIIAFGNLTYTGPLPLNDIGKLLFKTVGLEPRQLPVSEILNQRQEQLTQWIGNWNQEMEDKFLAENFYLDFSRKHRIDQIEEILQKAGKINSVSKLEPINQLRGRFKLEGDKGLVEIFFTLTPEKNPKVQQLDVSFAKSDN